MNLFEGLSYNIYFDISAIVIYIIVIITYGLKKHVPNSSHFFLTNLLICSFLTPILDIAGSVVICRKMSVPLVVGVNTLYYLTKQGTTFFFLLFILAQLESRKAFPVAKKLCLVTPIFLITVMILVNTFTGILFTYSEPLREYHSQKLPRSLTFAVTDLYYAWAFFYVLRNRKILDNTFRKLIYIISTANIIMELTQLHFHSLLLHSFSFSLSMLLILLNLDHYGTQVDPITGICKKEYLEDICRRLIHSQNGFNAILIKVTNYELNTSKFGIEIFEQIISKMENDISSIVTIGRAFKISQDSYALIYDLDKTSEILAAEILYSLKNPFKINGIDYLLEYIITNVNCPDNVKNLEQFENYITNFCSYNAPVKGLVSHESIQISDKIWEKKIAGKIEEGFENGNFEVYYQPICTAKEQNFITAEALLRLKDPDIGFISPADFIPVAEQNGQILRIGNFVLEEVCKFIEKHNMEELGLKYIEVNLSTIQCYQRDFIQTIDSITAEHNISSDYICFEITETGSNMSPAIFTDNLAKLSERGYILALDDFGTGYGNLERMVTSEFKIIKFDKVMIEKLTNGDQMRKMYKTLQNMITGMGSDIVSEGIETKEQYEFVRDAGCGYIQGYYFSRPLPETEFINFLKEKKENY